MSVETVRLIWEMLMDVVHLSLFALQILILWRLFIWWAYEKPAGYKRTGPIEPRILMRRLWCRHRAGYASVTNAWGLPTKVCVRCSKDMNAGKRVEDRV